MAQDVALWLLSCLYFGLGREGEQTFEEKMLCFVCSPYIANTPIMLIIHPITPKHPSTKDPKTVYRYYKPACNIDILFLDLWYWDVLEL
jgi:hypothetical protein